MSEMMRDQYYPDYAVIPGETVLETIESLGMSQAELAVRTGRPAKTINGIIQGKVAITSDTALQFERVLGVQASFWNALQAQYQETVTRFGEERRLQQHLQWLQDMPVTEMTRLGWMPSLKDPVPQMQALLRFFGVASPDQWQAVWSGAAVAFRKSGAFQSDRKAVAAWLRRGEIEAQQIATLPFEADKFRNALQSIRSVTTQSPDVFLPRVVGGCAQAGVAVVFVPELRRTRVCGATRWLTSAKALIQLSLRYKADDQLWFTFFHEAGHILLHGKRDEFLDENVGEPSGDAKEQEANRFAADYLVPSKDLQGFLMMHKAGIGRDDIQQFSQKLGIAPGIVVGRLQHDGHLPYSHCNDLKQHFTWVKELDIVT
jgi:HTH-type transcriptional regulator/antitoxin HigA